MPHLDGEETFQVLQSIQPKIRVVINSGYIEREMLDRFEGLGFAGFLQKPTPMDGRTGRDASVSHQRLSPFCPSFLN
ncbi:MAG: DNA-binding NarL/FixJ family response regulator [Planctomycetota bacterium]|jgi:DNA-binding NarL/FixJ family response regulator